MLVTVRGANREIHMRGNRIVADPPPGTRIIDLPEHVIWPGLVNAHDHLELNHYPRTKFRDRYDNAHDWGEDVNARLDHSPYRELRAHRLWDRCFIGGLKNLLSGTTTVAQHGPLYRPLRRRDFPVRVLRAYGWAHSLHFNNEQEIQVSYRKTPRRTPWFIHLGEGTDDRARSELEHLKQLGCTGPNTVIVHGVGAKATETVRGLVWCPSTNLYLLGQTADIAPWGTRVALGSDSRLTADGDLLDEMQAAYPFADKASIHHMVLEGAASLLGLADAGHLRPSAQADWFAIPKGAPLSRHHISLVVRGGIPQIGEPPLMAQFSHIRTERVKLDGTHKAVHTKLARQIMRCQLKEPGLTILG